MGRDIRQEILQKAKELFNESGYNNVSTRDISEALGISKGNLTYHFKKKEDIMEAILLEPSYTSPPKAPTTLIEMDAFFLNIQQTVHENAFYFWHHAQLAQLSPKIQELQHNVYRSNVEKFKQALQTLYDNGIIRQEIFSNEYSHIIDTILLSMIYWIPFCRLKQVKSSDGTFQQQAWSILYPLLTNKGIDNLNEIVSIL
jgi:AcrR family transcriptional regulator